MAAITLPTSVKPTSNTKFAPLGILGATVVIGQSLYQDATDSKWYLCDNNNTLAIATIKGVAFTAGTSGDYALIAISGSVIYVGSTLVVGESYYVSSTAGSIIPSGDLAAGNYISRVGDGATATQLDLSIKATGIVKA